MVKAAPAATLVVAKAEFLLQFLIVALDPPAQLGQLDRYRRGCACCRRAGWALLCSLSECDNWPQRCHREHSLSVTAEQQALTTAEQQVQNLPAVSTTPPATAAPALPAPSAAAPATRAIVTAPSATVTPATPTASGNTDEQPTTAPSNHPSSKKTLRSSRRLITSSARYRRRSRRSQPSLLSWRPNRPR